MESKKGEVKHYAHVFNFQAFELWILVFEEGKRNEIVKKKHFGSHGTFLGFNGDFYSSWTYL